MIIAPVIFLTVSTGIASVGGGRTLGRLTVKTFAYFLFFSTLALVIGLIVANVVQPGAGMNIDPRTLDPGAVAKIAEYDAKAHDTTLVGFLLAIIPTTFVSALTSGSILQALFAAILFGIALSHTGAAGAQVLGMLEKLSSVFFYLVGMLMRFAPIGAFGAMAFTIGEYGVESLVNLSALIATFYLTSILFVVVVLGAMARFSGFSSFPADCVSQGRTAARAWHLVVRSRVAQPDGKAGKGRLCEVGRRHGRAHGIQLQPRRHQHLYDARRAVRRTSDGHRPQPG